MEGASLEIQKELTASDSGPKLTVGRFIGTQDIIPRIKLFLLHSPLTRFCAGSQHSVELGDQALTITVKSEQQLLLFHFHEWFSFADHLLLNSESVSNLMTPSSRLQYSFLSLASFQRTSLKE
jgi:hypothetical protein